MKAIAKHVRISPKKANLVAGMVRRRNALEALDILKFTPKKGAKILYKVLHSAIANAQANFKQKKESLVIKEIVVTEGRTLKRSVPVSRGRVHPILKRTSHITVSVGPSEVSESNEVKETKSKKATNVGSMKQSEVKKDK